MPYSFDGENKLIILTSGTTVFDVSDLYSTWKEWILINDNSKYPQAFNAIGGDPVSATLFVAPYFFLLNGWKIRPQESTHILTVNGNLYVDGGVGNPFIQTNGNYNVTINLATSTNAVAVQDGSSLAIEADLELIKRKLNDLMAVSV